jgi:hypothetical protein
MNLRDVTVVILSRGREQILAQTLNYWAEIDISVLVLHNSQSPLDPGTLGDNIEYHVLPVSYGERCGKVAKLLKTEFGILSADDEIYIPSAIWEMKTLLNAEQYLSSVGGLTIAIGRYGPIETGAHSYSNMSGYENLGDHAYERIKNHFSNFPEYRNGGIYRLLRKDLMIDLMKMLDKVGTFSSPYIYEVTGEIIINSYGAAKYVNNIYWIRNWINDPVTHKNWDRKSYFKDWLTEPRYKQEVLSWHQTMKSYLKLSDELYEECITDVINLRINSENREMMQHSRKSIPIPEILKWFIRKLFCRNTLPRSFKEALEKMEENGAIFDSVEIVNAKSFLN